MTENLRLTGSRTLKPADSNVSSNWTLPAQNTDTWCNRSLDETCVNTSDNLYSDNATYGTYYSWAAATAGTGTYSMTSGNASSSICPKGWRLPTGGDSGEFQTLYDNYNSYELMTNNDGPAFVLSGFRSGGSTSDQGSAGYYWSSTALASSSARNLLLSDSSSGVVWPAHGGTKNRGFSVRCVASDQDFWSISTMQEMTPEIVSSVVTPSTTAASAVTNATDYANTYDKTSVVPERILTDARDGETYRVRKLADGNVWMTENLRLTLTEGQAIEISDGSMWLPKNYDGTTTNSTTLTIADYDNLPTIWGFTDNTQSTTDVVRSFDTKGIAGEYKCNPPNVKTKGTNMCYETINTADNESQKVGVFYNWYTATAGQGSVASSSDTTKSICPKNWNIPSSLNSTTEPSWYRLYYSLYGRASASARSFPTSLIIGGFFAVDETATVAAQTTMSNLYSSYMTRNNGKNSDGSPSLINRATANMGTGSLTVWEQERKRMGGSIRCAISGL